MRGKLLAGLLLGGVAWWCLECQAAVKKEQANAQPQESDGQEAVLHMKGVYLEEFGESGRTLELWAESARYSRLKKQVDLLRVRVLAPARQGGTGQRVELKGDSGQADMDNKVVHIQGDVRILTEDGYQIFTDRATYDYEAREIEGPDQVYMEGPEGTTNGTGLHVWLEKEMVLIREKVQTMLRPEALQKAKEKMRP
jgi:LPS export ABC transporter protein LptC